jgi:hypothetical protein
MRFRSTFPLFAALAASVSCGLLSGCANSFDPSPVQTELTDMGEVQGSVHGGQFPIAGSHIYVYAAGTGGIATAATSLLPHVTGGGTGKATTKDGNGNYYISTTTTGGFTLPSTYCTVGTQVYIVAVGGDSSGGTTHNNTAIVQMAALGQCPSSGTMAQLVPYLQINEISTAVMAYAVGGFGTDAYHIASSGTTLGKTGIANAFANVPNIISVAVGGPSSVAGANRNSSVPMAKIYTLANILAACVNTNANTSTACTNLFAAATSDGTTNGTKPTDESGAIFNIVHNPMVNVSTLFAMAGATPPFAGGLVTAPNDFTMPIVYNSVVGKAGNIAFDGSGNAWISDLTKKAVVKVSPVGVTSTFTNGGTFGTISNVAVAPGPAGTIWAADQDNNKLYLLSSTGTVSTTVTTGGLNKPAAIAFNAAGQAYIVNAPVGTVGVYGSTGSFLSTDTLDSVLGSASAIALDTNGNVYIPGNNLCDCLDQIASGANAATEFADGLFGGALNLGNATNVAVDSSNNAWMATSANEVVQLTPANFNITFGGHTYYNDNYLTATTTGKNGGLNSPATLSIDGANNLWVANSGNNTVSGFTNGGTALATSGIPNGGATSSVTNAVAPDGSGNLWTANSDGTVVQLLGLATPVATPVVPGQLGTEP